MTNPFEDENALYHVLINDEGQHSLWPVFATVPDGWTIIHKSDSRSACLDFINRNWTDMRPKSLVASMEAKSGEEQQVASPEHEIAQGLDASVSGTETKH